MSIKKTVYEITINFIYESARRGAKYSFDGGKHWVNAGEAVEIILKACLGYDAEKDANTRFDLGSDIEPIHASVKSPAFTLTSEVIGSNFDEVLSNYFLRTASDKVAYGIIAGDSLIVYWMDMEAFKDYLNEWGTWEASRKVIRGKKLSKGMLNWLDKRAE